MKDDDQRIDTAGAATLITELMGVKITAKTVQNWRNKGEFEPGDWQWFGRTATTTKGRVHRFVARRVQDEPARRRNTRQAAAATTAVQEFPPAA